MLTHLNESRLECKNPLRHATHLNESCHTREWVMSHTRMGHATHTNTPCHTHERVMSHTRMNHVTHTNEPCHTLEWAMSRTRISNATHTNESRHTYPWVWSHMSRWHVGMSHVTPLNESCLQCVHRHPFLFRWPPTTRYIPTWLGVYLCTHM